MYAIPLGYHALNNGIGVSYPLEVNIIQSSAYSFLQAYKVYNDPTDFVITLDGLVSQQANVDSFSDLHVTAVWSDGINMLNVTIGRGLPFTYVKKSGNFCSILYGR